MAGHYADEAANKAAKMAEINARLSKVKAAAAQRGVSAKERSRSGVMDQPTSPKTAAQSSKLAALKQRAAITKRADDLLDEWEQQHNYGEPPEYSYFVRMAEKELSGKGCCDMPMRGSGLQIPLAGSTRPW
jgi:hypothetical protein